MRIALIANPWSGAGRDPSKLAAALRAAGAEDVTLCLVGDGLAGARECEPERIVLAGGDGSIAPAAALAGEIGVPLAVLPIGTANDFARATGLPRELDAAIALAVNGTRLAPCELGCIDGEQPFVNVASTGLSSVAAELATPLKPRLGPLAYAVAAAQAGATGVPVPVTVTADGRPVFAGGVWQAIVACTGAFGAGSGVGETDPADGLLDLVLIPESSRARLPQRAWGLRLQSIAEQSGVIAERTATVVLRRTDGSPLGLNVDGEVVDRGSPAATFTARADGFRLVVPDEGSG